MLLVYAQSAIQLGIKLLELVILLILLLRSPGLQSRMPELRLIQAWSAIHILRQVGVAKTPQLPSAILMIKRLSQIQLTIPRFWRMNSPDWYLHMRRHLMKLNFQWRLYLRRIHGRQRQLPHRPRNCSTVNLSGIVVIMVNSIFNAGFWWLKRTFCLTEKFDSTSVGFCHGFYEEVKDSPKTHKTMLSPQLCLFLGCGWLTSLRITG